MPVIGQQTFVLAPTSDKYLSLTNEEFVRKLDLTGFGNNWSRIRIAMNCSLANTGGGSIGPRFVLFVGLCSGTAFPFQSQQCVNAVGYVWGDPSGAQSGTGWTANAGNPYYTSAGLGYYGIRKVGQGTQTATIGSATWAFMATGGTLERRGWLCADIGQTSTTGTQRGNTFNSAVASSDVWYEHSVYAANQGGVPMILESLAPNNTQTQTFGGGWNTNPLDTVNIFWGCPNYDLRIYALTVCFTP